MRNLKRVSVSRRTSATETGRFVFESSLIFTVIIMVEQFVGTWTLAASENFDDYMKAIGQLIELSNDLILNKISLTRAVHSHVKTSLSCRCGPRHSANG